MRGRVTFAGCAMLTAALVFGPTSAASQAARSEPLGGALVLLVHYSSAGADSTECARRLFVRRVFLRSGHLQQDQGLDVCVPPQSLLRRLMPSGGVSQVDWSELKKGDLLHIELSRFYVPTRPLRVRGTNVVLVARDTG